MDNKTYSSVVGAGEPDLAYLDASRREHSEVYQARSGTFHVGENQLMRLVMGMQEDGRIPRSFGCTCGGEDRLAVLCDLCWQLHSVNGLVLEQLFIKLPTDMHVVDDYTVCKCKIHVVPLAGEPEDYGGCMSMPIGKAGAYKSAALGLHRACVIEPGVRCLDGELLGLLLRAGSLDYGGPVLSFHSDGPLSGMARYGTPRAVKVDQLGRGYCYTHVIRGRFRTRVSRILGPNPLVADFMRALVFTGASRGQEYALASTAAGTWHLEPRGGNLNATTLFMRCIRIVQFDPEARIGMDASSLGGNSGALASVTDVNHFRVPRVQPGYVGKPRVHALRQWLLDRDIYVPDVAMPSLALVTYALGAIPSDIPDGRAQARALALVGDGALKVVRAVQAYGLCLSVEEQARRTGAKESNAGIAKMAVESGFVDMVELGTASVESKALGTIVEGTLGVLYMFCGNDSAITFVNALGMGISD